MMVRENTFNQRIRNFVQQEMEFPGTTIVSCQPDYATRSFSVVLIGDDVDSATIASRRERMPSYRLGDVTMNVVQTNTSTLSKELQRLAITKTDASRQTEIVMTKQSQQLHDAEMQLKAYTETASLAPSILSELQILYPQVQSITIAKGQYASADTTHQQTVAFINIAPMQHKRATPHNLSDDATNRLTQWLQQRTGIPALHVIILRL